MRNCCCVWAGSSARDKLWGKARDYFESSYRVQRSPEICAELGRLLSGLGEPKVAAAYYREGLLLSTTGCRSCLSRKNCCP